MAPAPTLTAAPDTSGTIYGRPAPQYAEQVSRPGQKLLTEGSGQIPLPPRTESKIGIPKIKPQASKVMTNKEAEAELRKNGRLSPRYKRF